MPPRQHTPQQYLDAVKRHGGSRIKAARELKVTTRTLAYNLAQMRADGVEIPESVDGLTKLYANTPTVAVSKEDQKTIADLRAQLEAVTTVKRWAAAKPKNRTTPKPRGAKHMYVPDTQVKCGVPIGHLEAAGHYAVEKRPDTIILAGDWWDFPSLSSYDRGKLCFEGRRYRLDVEAGKAGMEKFLVPIRKARGYEPRIVMTLGNHCHRIVRAIDEDSRLEGLMGLHDLQLDAFGIEHHEFLKTVVIDGISYCHYFPRSAAGSVGQSKRGAPNAKAQLTREGRSAVAGHQQGLEMHCQPLAGRLQWGIIAGSFYQHDEGYLTPQGNDHWRGLLMFHEVKDGAFTPMVVSMDYLLAEYL